MSSLTDLHASTWMAAAERLLGYPVSDPRALGGGRNSRVFRLDTSEGPVVAKLYVREPGDARDRLEQEFRALTFLWEAGERAIPEPLAVDRDRGFGLYGFLDGAPVANPSDAEIGESLEFLKRLHGYGALHAAEMLPPASEAFFRFSEIRKNLHFRLERLDAVDAGRSRESGLADFVQSELRPKLARFLARCRLDEDVLLPNEGRILSPSDFGFHNCIRRTDGHLAFLDFEYFGWDDPAKTLCDFLLHPGMALPRELRCVFRDGLLRKFTSIPELASRAEATFLLYGLKWCLILLNEFLPGPLSRRTIAAEGGLVEKELQARQLAKSRHLLRSLEELHEYYWPT
jgi:hypothetical protein